MSTRTRRIGVGAVIGLLASVLALLPATPSAAQLPGVDGRITFNRDGANYTADPDGTDVRRITPTDQQVFDGPAAFSPDGTELVFARSTPQQMRELYVSNADGTGTTRVTVDQSSDKQSPSWSPDGNRIVFVRGTRVATIGVDGSGLVEMGPADANRPSFSPDGSRILYYAYSSETGANDIFTMPATGGTPTRLTFGQRDELNLSPDYSPDGTRIVFTSDRNPSPYRYSRVWVMDADGSNPVLLHADGMYDGMPRWSPSGDRILFDGWTAEGSRLFTIDPEGGSLTQLDTGAGLYQQDRVGSWQRTFAPAPRPTVELALVRDRKVFVGTADGVSFLVDGEDADLSPDGSRLVFSRFDPDTNLQDLWAVDVDGANLVQLTSTPDVAEQHPAWSPDGRIAFLGGIGNQLVVMDADGSGRVEFPATDVSAPTFSPDGSTIVYSAPSATGAHDLWSVPAGGGQATALTSSSYPTLNLYAAFSPDGSQIAFVSNRDPSPYLYDRVWVMDADGGDQRLVHPDGMYDRFVHWTPDGDIAFSGWTSDGDRVFRMEADGTDVRRLDLGAARYSDDWLEGWRRTAAAPPPPPGPSDPPPTTATTAPPSTTTTTAPPPPDTTPPDIDLRVPADGATYAVGDVVAADYGCSDPSGVRLCHGSVLGGHVPSGQLLDTSVSGVFAFIVETHDDLDPWNFTYEVHVYSVVAPHGTAATRVEDGGYVTTDPGGLGATPDAPVQTQVVAPSGVSGVITVQPQPTTTSAPTGFSMFGTETVLEGPVATAAQPYEVSFTVDGSVLGGVAPADVQVFRNGTVVTGCTHPTAAVPDPCVVHRGWAPDGSGDAVVTVRTSHFSTWSLGRLAYRLEGPLAPLRAAPAVNDGKAGSTIPVRFRLGGDRGLDVLADPAGAVQYDAASATYTYLWRTTKAMAGSRELVLRFRDGSELRTLHRLR